MTIWLTSSWHSACGVKHVFVSLLLSGLFLCVFLTGGQACLKVCVSLCFLCVIVFCVFWVFLQFAICLACWVACGCGSRGRIVWEAIRATSRKKLACQTTCLNKHLGFVLGFKIFFGDFWDLSNTIRATSRKKLACQTTSLNKHQGFILGFGIFLGLLGFFKYNQGNKQEEARLPDNVFEQTPSICFRVWDFFWDFWDFSNAIRATSRKKLACQTMFEQTHLGF